MISIFKIILIVLLAGAILAYLKNRALSIKTFQWLAKIVIAVSLILILGIIIGLF